MSERSVGRPWTSQEDDLLSQAVAINGEIDNWKAVALYVPGRSNKACRKRWLHSLSPGVKKSAWTPEEDHALLELYRIHSTKWSVIARQIPGRTDDACSKRYREALDPTLKRDEWTPDEDIKLLEANSRLGGRWCQVGQELQRSGLSCRNRWRLLERKRSTSTWNESAFVPHYPSAGVNPESIPMTDCSSVYAYSGPDYTESNLYFGDQSHLTYQSQSLVSTASISLQEPAYYVNAYPSTHHTYGDVASRTTFPGHIPWPTASTAAGHGIYEIHDSNGYHDYNTATRPLALAVDGPDHLLGPDECSYSVDPKDYQSTLEARSQGYPFNPAYSSIVHHHDDMTNSTHFVSEDGNHVSDTNNHRYNHSEQAVYVHSTQLVPFLKDQAPGSNEAVPLIQASDAHYNPEQERSQNHYGTYEGHHNSSMSKCDGNPPTYNRYGEHFVHAEWAYNHHHSYTHTHDDGPNVAQTSCPTNCDIYAPSGPPPEMLPIQSEQKTDPIEGSCFIPAAKPPRKRPDTQAPSRLSSDLPATSDPSITPYACGHPKCWPSTSDRSSTSFSTSRELSDHHKLVHVEDPGDDRPFRCGLDSCGKSWKSINGLQYHLQISKAHFQQAISSTFIQTLDEDAGVPSKGDTSSDGGELHKKIYLCPHPNCRNRYKQLSGLRYHLTHGHPPEMPLQLDLVPPALARRLTEKMLSQRSGSQSSGSLRNT